MNRWLEDESKWAREKALEAKREAEHLADPAWVKRRLVTLGRDERAFYDALDVYLRVCSEAETLKDDDRREERRERCLRDAEHWQQLAEEQSARLAQTADEAALFDEAAP